MREEQRWGVRIRTALAAIGGMRLLFVPITPPRPPWPRGLSRSALGITDWNRPSKFWTKQGLRHSVLTRYAAPRLIVCPGAGLAKAMSNMIWFPTMAGLALTALGSFAPARATAPDAWQTYMDAAAAAITDGDDSTAALALGAARAVAIAKDFNGIRAHYTHLELFFVHSLLLDAEAAKEDVERYKPTSEATTDAGLADFGETTKIIADAYLARWTSSVQGTGTERTLLANGVEFNNGIRVQLLEVLRPDDKAALASALLDKGKSDFEVKKYELAIQALNRSISLGDELQARREKLRAASRALSPAATGSKSMPSDLETDVGGAVAFEARNQLVQTLNSKGWSLMPAKPDEAANQFRASIVAGTELLKKHKGQLVSSERDANLEMTIGWDWLGVCEAIKKTPDPAIAECASEGAGAFEQAMAMFAGREGDRSPNTIAAATAYVRFLHNVYDGANAKADEIDRRYELNHAFELTDFGVAAQDELMSTKGANRGQKATRVITQDQDFA